MSTEDNNEDVLIPEETTAEKAETVQETVETSKTEKNTAKKQTETKTTEEKKKAIPRLFFKNDSRVEIIINGYHSNETGSLMFAVPKENDNEKETFDNLFTREVYRFWFTRVPYDKLNRYRTRSMIYNSEDQNNTINELKLREFFLVFHLVDWDLKDEDGKKIELKFDTNKALSDESLELIYTLPSNLLDVVLSTFEKKMGLA